MKFMPRRVVLYFFFLICIYHISHLKVESAESTESAQKISDKTLVEVGENVFKASKMLEYASLSLRSSYITADSTVGSFVDLRRSVTNEAKVYSIEILPIATTLIQRLQEFSEYYDVLSFDEFKEFLHDLTIEAKENYLFSKYVLELHKAILVDFKKLDGQANIVLRNLEMEARKYEEDLDKLRREVNDSAVDLAMMIPIVKLMLANVRENPISQAIAVKEKKMLAVAAARAIQGPLLMSIREFIDAIG
jgi:hypothetical protein